MKTFIVLLTASIFMFSASFSHHYNIQPMTADELKNYLMGNHELAAVTCFVEGETTSGMNKICFYDCLGSAYAITISGTDLCPLNVKN
tara:strand:- start:749 stop:1012 length:264 start_codon:yes stop_codon:yes gene_type:complete